MIGRPDAVPAAGRPKVEGLMARRAPRSEAVTVAELLVRSAATHDRHRVDDTRARHREKSPALRSLARLRVFSVVAGALALTGGVATAVSMPAGGNAGADRPPVGLEPVAAPLVPFPADIVVPPAKSAPESVAPSVEPGGIVPVVAESKSNSVASPAHRGNLAKAVKIIGKVKLPVKPLKQAKPQGSPKQAAPVRHEIPDPSLWWRGWSAGQDGGHHHGCGGGGRHRR
jgi:hypothetical protein